MEGRVVGVVVNQVVYLLNRASSMVGESVLDTDEGLVNTRLLVPRLISPEKVVAGRVVGTLLNQVVHPLYRVSNRVWLNTLTTLLALVNCKLKVFKLQFHIVLCSIRIQTWETGFPGSIIGVQTLQHSSVQGVCDS